MNQLDTLAEMDAELHAAFADAGLADRGHYTAPGANVDLPVRIYIDRTAQVRGDFGQVVGRRIEMGILLADADPKAKGSVWVEFADKTGGETFTLVDKLDEDGTLSRWVVRLG